MGSIPGWGTKIPHAVCPINKIKQLIKKSLLQHHSSKASILWHSAFFIVQLSHLYLTSGKTITLNMWSFVSLRKNKYFSWYIKNVSFVFMTVLTLTQQSKN